MYKIRPDILETLICTECSCIVSCGPVKLKIIGGIVCGRCVLPDNTFIVDSPYETLAKMILFPCRYNKEGCTQESAFNVIKEHEQNCGYKLHTCPIAADDSCPWKGLQKDLIEHLEQGHVYENLTHPCTIAHMFDSNNINNYKTIIDGLTFSIHIKVCLLKNQLYHCVRFIGDSNCASYFEFTLSMESSKSKLVKTKCVSAYDSFVLEDDSIVTNISELQNVLGELQNISFVVSIKQLLDIIRCDNCQNIIHKFMYKSNNKYKCEKCVPPSRKCRNCDYKDFKPKSVKHTKYFCKNKKFGGKVLPTIEPKNPLEIITASNAIPESIVNKYPEFFHQNGQFWKTRVENFPNTLSNVGTKVIHAVKHDFGYALCDFFKFKQVQNSNVVIYFNVYAPLATEVLNLYDCHLCISRPDKNFKFEGFLEREYEFEADWTIKIDYFHYYDSCHDLHIKITFLPKDIYKHPNAGEKNKNK